MDLMLGLQAYVQKHARHRSPHDFAPATLREMAPTARLGAEPLAYVKLEGLGKIPFSSIRRPKPLMDVAVADDASASEEEDAETIGTVVQVRPLTVAWTTLVLTCGSQTAAQPPLSSSAS